jgi:NitT/TauT family transport system substrate-binding protein
LGLSNWWMIPISGCVLVALACGGSSAPEASPTVSPRAMVPSAGPAATAVLPTVAAVAAPTVAPPPAPVTVRVSRTQGLGNTLQIPVVRGYFREQGLQIEHVEFGSSAEAIPPLATGDVDAGAQAPNAAFFNALARGIRIALALDASHVQPGGRGFPLMSRLVEGSPVVQSLTDLRGKRFAHNQRGVITEPAMERMLAEAGLGVSDLADLHFLPFPDIMAAFGGGTIDASIMPEPFGTIAEERGLGARVRQADDYISGAMVAMIVFSEKFVRERPDPARRFAVAYLRGARDFMDAMEHGRDREAILTILAEAARVEARIWDKSGYFPIRRDGRVNAEALVTFADWMMEHGYLQQKPDIESLVDHRFADHAAQTLDSTR